jgi:hypothetical protein
LPFFPHCNINRRRLRRRRWEIRYTDLMIIATAQEGAIMGGLETGTCARPRAIMSVLEANLIAGDFEANRALIEAHPDIVRVRYFDGEFLLHWLCRNAGARRRANADELVAFVASEWPQALQERDAEGLLPLHRAVQFTEPNLGLFRTLVAAPSLAPGKRTSGVARHY